MQVVLIPGHRIVRRQDGPVHSLESSSEKGGGDANNAVIGSVPGNVVFRIVRRLHFAKAHERFHLVHVASNRLLHLMQFMNVIVGCYLEKAPLAMSQPPQGPVQQFPAVRLTMTGDVAGQFKKRLRDLQCRRCVGTFLLVA